MFYPGELFSGQQLNYGVEVWVDGFPYLLRQGYRLCWLTDTLISP